MPKISYLKISAEHCVLHFIASGLFDDCVSTTKKDGALRS